MSCTLTLVDSSGSRRDLVPGALECVCTDEGPDLVCVHVAGELDIATAPLLEHMLRSAEHRASRIVLDISEVKYIDSSGAGVVADASVRARRAERRLILVREPSHVDRAFRPTGNSNLFEIGDLVPVEPQVRLLSYLARGNQVA
jgi:anti-sigma B factor antagonist